MDVKLEQRGNIKFSFKLGKSGAETFEILRRRMEMRPCVLRSVSRGARFKRGRTSLEDDEMSGRTSKRPTPENVETIRWLVHVERRRTTKGNAAIVSVSYRTVQIILTSDLNIHCVAEKFVPRLLTSEQKDHRVAICLEIRQRALDDQLFMSSIITGDENWVYWYEPETKKQSSQ
jgi:hypothetical protein